LQVISNPFDDIVPRVRKSKTSDVDAESKKFDKKGTKLVILTLILILYEWKLLADCKWFGLCYRLNGI